MNVNEKVNTRKHLNLLRKYLLKVSWQAKI